MRRPGRRRAGRVVGVLLAGAALLASYAGPPAVADQPVGQRLAASVASAVPLPTAQVATVAGEAARPLVVVLDVSGSMSEEDVDGTVKLAGAITALTTSMRQQRPGSELGLWTYPGRASCSPGVFDVPVAAGNADTMVTALAGLSADGDTPTGSALRSVADTLTAKGYVGATVLLISDGESNCEGESPPPCDVAEEIVAEGFDLTVEAAGFQISDAGLAELGCIADATGGSLYEADDADDLTSVVGEATSTQLLVEVVDAPTRVPSGLAGRITVRVTNPNAREVVDPRLSMSFAVPGDDPIVPAVIPPRVSLATMAGGETREHTWTVTFGGQGKTGTARYRILASSVSGQPVKVEGEVEVAGDRVQLDQAGPLISELAGRRIVILGDSFSSGEGAGNYEPGTFGDSDSANDCHRSYETYLSPLFPLDAVRVLACSGAVTGLGDEDEDNVVVPDQVDVLRSLQEDPPAAAFMTIGGNDIGFSDIIKACTFPVDRDGLVRDAVTGVVADSWLAAFASFEQRSHCADNRTFVETTFEKLEPRSGLVDHLGETYRSVYGALNTPTAVSARGEVAPLVVLAYPQIFAPARFTTGRCPRFDGREIDFANELVTRLNRVVREAVNRVRSDGLRVHVVETMQEAVLPDNSACPGNPAQAYINSLDYGVVAAAIEQGLEKWVFGRSNSPQNEYLHPNAAGYRAETNVLLSWSVGADTSLPEGRSEWFAPEETSIVRTLLDWVDSLTPTLPWKPTVTFDALDATWSGDVGALRAGQPVRIEVVNAAPGSEVYLSVRSRPTPLGSVAIGQDGGGTADQRLPERLAPGAHELSAVGFDRDGRAVAGSVEVDVATALPGWITPVLALVLVLSAAWLAATLVVRHRTRPRPEPSSPASSAA